MEEREEIIVDVASGISRRGKHSKRIMSGRKVRGTSGRLSASGESGDGLEANGFHIPAAFKGVSFVIVLHIVADMSVTAKELNRRVPLLATDRFEQGCIFWGAEGDMSSDEEEIDLAVSDCVLKPFLFDGFFNRLNDGIVRIRREIEYEAECQDSNTLVLGRELSEPWG